MQIHVCVQAAGSSLVAAAAAAAVSTNVIIFALGGWMCGSLRLVIKTVNDRGGVDKKAWGECGEGVCVCVFGVGGGLLQS